MVAAVLYSFCFRLAAIALLYMGFAGMLGFGKLLGLVRTSLVKGLPLLIVLFAGMAGLIVLMLGSLSPRPMDILPAPGANISIGIGVYVMIPVLVWVGRHPAGSMFSLEAWRAVCSGCGSPLYTP